MTKAESVLLAHEFNPDKHSLAGNFLSDKLDGVRAWWDGGVSRGFPAGDVPYANTEKDHKRLVPPVATGLWTRTNKVVNAPSWFLDLLPKFPLDGELYCGPGKWQQTQSIVSRDEPDERWHLVEYKIIDSPCVKRLFQARTVKVRNDYSFSYKKESLAWVKGIKGVPEHWSFEFVYKWLSNRFSFDGQVSLVNQIELPFSPLEALEKTMEHAKLVVEAGGEGAIVRKRIGLWIPERSWDVLKVKPWFDAEGVVTGYFSGKKTEKDSTWLGMMGALELNWEGATFKISGFNGSERQLNSLTRDWAINNPGSRFPDEFESQIFPRGSRVTFKYRELSDDGIPKEARHLRRAE